MGLRNEEKVGTLENEAQRRRERLLALKRKRKETDEEEAKNEAPPADEDDDQELPTTQVLFRNYKPQSEVLEDAQVPAAKPGDIEAIVKQQEEDGEKAKEEVEVEMNNLAPKKITFDLKRGIQAQLDKLDRKTDRAIAELIRQRLKEGKQQDFFIAVQAEAKQRQRSAYDSDSDEG